MFGSTNRVEQSSSSSTTSPFDKPLGSTNPFGSPTGSSVVGGMSTGIFGQPSTPSFGASSAPAVVSSTPAFGASFTPAFGSPSSAFGGSSIFGQKPAFGGFGSTPSQSSPLGTTFQQTQPSFGSNLFSSTTPFGATSQPAFGGTSTPAFGSSSTPAFGATSTPAFAATSTPAFAATSTPAFGSILMPAFGGFGSTPSQSTPLGSTFQQTQPSFGRNLFSSTTPFGATSQPAFGAIHIPAFGSSSTPAFGATSTPAFAATSTPAFAATSTPAFGSTLMPAFGTMTIPAFGSSQSPIFSSAGTGFGVSTTPAFGSSVTPAFGAQSTPLFGSSSTPAFGSSVTTIFGAQSTPRFGSSSTPAFGASSIAAFGASTAPTFGASSTPSFSFGSSPSFGQTTSIFHSTPFGTTPSAFGAQSFPFGAQLTTPTFGSPGFEQSAFGGPQGGSRVAAYSVMPEVDGGSGTTAAGKLKSISAMPVYKAKSHEELRWEDYQCGDKGGPNPAGQPAIGISFPVPTEGSPFGSTGTFGQPASNPFASPISSNIFRARTSTFGYTGFGSSSTSLFGSSLLSSSLSSPFGATSTAPSLFGRTSASVFGSNAAPSIFSGTTAPAFGSSPSLFSSSMVGASFSFGSGLTFGNTQASGLLQSSASSFAQTQSPFGQPYIGFQQSTPASGSSLFSTPSTSFGGSLFGTSALSVLSTSSHLGFGQATQPSISTAFQSAGPTQTLSAFSFGNFRQTQPASSSGFGGISTIFMQSTFGQLSTSQPNIVMQPAPATSLFGTLPAVPQMSFVPVGSSPSVQYGISSMPVAEKLISVRVSSFIAPRHVSRRIRLPARKYHPKIDGPRVPFFVDDEGIPSMPKADAHFIPRENPRALIVRPVEQWLSRKNVERESLLKEGTTSTTENVLGGVSAPASNGSFADHNETPTKNGHFAERDNAQPTPSRPLQKSNGVHDDHVQKGTDSSYRTISGHRAGDAAIVYEHGADIETLMPRLWHADYYTEPRVQELAAKEQAEPGFCCHVKDFVVGRHDYGSIKFDGETDVRRLDLESIIQFNHREVIVYKDESKKPSVGQGLNKPAEVTLLNIKCISKKTGQQYTEGPKVEKYKEMLMKKAEEQGAEFVSYDPVKGEWKFRVEHFCSYELVEWQTGL